MYIRYNIYRRFMANYDNSSVCTKTSIIICPLIQLYTWDVFFFFFVIYNGVESIMLVIYLSHVFRGRKYVNPKRGQLLLLFFLYSLMKFREKFEKYTNEKNIRIGFLFLYFANLFSE